MSLHIRDLPDDVHARLAARAEASGRSLRQYVIDVLSGHCALPTMEEWLREVEGLPPAAGDVDGAALVRAAREADDAQLDRYPIGPLLGHAWDGGTTSRSATRSMSRSPATSAPASSPSTGVSPTPRPTWPSP